jgi:hypothetical protein
MDPERSLDNENTQNENHVLLTIMGVDSKEVLRLEKNGDIYIKEKFFMNNPRVIKEIHELIDESFKNQN